MQFLVSLKVIYLLAVLHWAKVLLPLEMRSSEVLLYLVLIWYQSDINPHYTTLSGICYAHHCSADRCNIIRQTSALLSPPLLFTASISDSITMINFYAARGSDNGLVPFVTLFAPTALVLLQLFDAVTLSALIIWFLLWRSKTEDPNYHVSSVT